MPDLNVWFTVAVVILFLQLFVFGLVFVALFYGGAWGVGKLTAKLREWVPVGQRYVFKATELTKTYTTKVAEPPIRIASQAEGLRHALNVLLRRD